MVNDWQKAQEVLKNGGVAFVPTDTLYGLLASAFYKKAVEKIYKIRARDKGKPCIILISSFLDLKKFNIVLNEDQKKFLKKVWPGKISVILPCKDKKFQYLHRGTKTIAFRMIGQKNKNLHKILKTVGPLVAPSANPQGMPPARSRKEARKYFGEDVDAYVCVGIRKSKPSTIIEYKKNNFAILRKGAVEIKKD